MPGDNWIEVQVTRIIKETDAAFLVEIEEEEYWLPKSQIWEPETYSESDEDVSMEITRFIADTKGISGE